jgi:hypothetical protein
MTIIFQNSSDTQSSPRKYRIFVSLHGAVTTQAFNARMRALLRM